VTQIPFCVLQRLRGRSQRVLAIAFPFLLSLQIVQLQASVLRLGLCLFLVEAVVMPLRAPVLFLRLWTGWLLHIKGVLFLCCNPS
jgi:hypothetical protein